MNLILLGPPGAGKGTQARLIQEYYGLHHLSTGEMLREEIQRETSIGQTIRETMAEGLFPSDEVVFHVFEEKLKGVKDQGVLLDGIPRTLLQADKVEEIFKRWGLTLDGVIQLEVDDAELIQRLVNRKGCKTCGAPATSETTICSVCGGKEFIKRSDDTLDAIKTRLEVYNTRTKPLVKYYAAKGVLKVVQGMQPVAEVFAQVKKELS